MNKWKICAKVVAFLAIFTLMGAGFSKVLVPKWVEWEHAATLYGLEEESLDVLFAGSSSFYVGFAPTVVWNETGTNSYVLGSSVQAPEVTYLKVADALKEQTPKVVVLGVLFLFEEYDVDAHESYVRLGVDPLRMSLEKAAVAMEIAGKSDGQTLESYLFPLLRYHDRWRELTEADFQAVGYDEQHGRSTYLQSRIEKIENLYGRMDKNAQPAQYNEESLHYYERTIELCQAKGIEVLLATAPRVDWSAPRAAAVRQLADRYGLRCVDYNDDELLRALEIDFDTDFYNEGHLNIQGATKLSGHMARYLQETYGLPDRRGEAELAASWEGDVEAFYGSLSWFERNVLSEVQ